MSPSTRILPILLLAVIGSARAEAAPPRFAATRAITSPRLDGRLDDLAWRDVPAADGFTQKFPKEGTAPSEPTTFKVIYDREAIWIGIECTQRTAPLVRRLTRRDRPIESDSVTVDLDTRGDGTSAFEFSVNAAGVLTDAIRFNDTDVVTEWDENWNARVALTERGWSAELRIPLRILRFDTLPEQSWGLQVRRYTSARQETDEWAFIPRDDAGEVSHYGKLDRLLGLRPPSPFELRVFALARARHRDPSSGVLASGWDGTGSAGLDLKWHLTQNLTLDATFNPDFAQVEADQVVLNLTTYEIFYPEKRPFFLEGVDVFTTPIGVFYTRRIGRAPEVPVLRTDAPWNEQLVDLPSASPIYGAAKLVGTLGRKLKLGALLALTGRNSVEVQAGDARLHRVVDPMTLFGVLRLNAQVSTNTEVGLMATSVSRFEPTGLHPLVFGGNTPTRALCPSGDLVEVGARCFHDAYVGGADVRWRSKGGGYMAQGQAIVSGIVGGPPRQLRDGTFVGAGDIGGGWLVHFAKQGGKHWLWDLTYDGASRKLDYNDLGFMTRQNLHHVDASVEYRTTKPWGKTLESHWRAEFYDRETLRGLNLARGYQLDTEGRFSNFWGWFAELHYRAAHFDDREVGDGTALERAGLIGVELALSTDSRRRVYFELFTLTQALFNGLNFDAEAKLTVRALPQLDFDLLPSVTHTFGEPRFAGAGALPGETLYGKLTATAIGATLRATYTFTPRLSLQLYAQLFLARKRFTELSAFSAPGQLGPVVHLTDLRPTGELPSVNPDLEEAVLNVNLVLRWEYLTGSTLFFVYTHAQTPDLSLMTGQVPRLDIGSIRRGPAADVLLLKLTYWWG